MKAIFVLLDSLTKNIIDKNQANNFLPNFKKISDKCFSFEKHYCGSFPCMPARRDLHTGRMHFLHCSWGPLEPFDKSFLDILRKEKNVYSHLITDHQHYFEQGGSGYHTQYSSWEFYRGQEGDSFKANLSFDVTKYKEKYNNSLYPIDHNSKIQNSNHKINHIINRECYIQKEDDFPSVKCFNASLDFLDINHNVDNWFLNIECFDPHEPFYAPERFREMAGVDESLPITDWPPYGKLPDTKHGENICKHYNALLFMCDEYLGRLLDKMDEYSLWNDTLFILTTDHGLLFGEHYLWGKSRESYYEEISHIPLYIHHPKYSGNVGKKCYNLTQTPEIMPTILDYFEASIPKEAIADSITPLLEKCSNNEQTTNEKTIIFGMFGGSVGITDGKYVYYHYPNDLYDENNLNEYTMAPQHMRSSFSLEELKTIELVKPFSFSQGIPLTKFKALNTSKRVPLEMGVGVGYIETESALYDVENDPKQANKIDDPKKIQYFKSELKKHFKLLDAPSEAYDRFTL